MGKIASTNTSRWTSAFWWMATLITLILLDDLIVGPVFWALSQVDSLTATVLAFVISFAFQVWVIRAGLRQEPRRLARRIISRLMLAHKSEQIVEREASIRRRITTTVGAVLVSLVIGGVLPVLLLHKSGRAGVAHLRRLAWLTSACYAVEFALLHGGYGLGALVGMLLDVARGWLV